MLLSFQWLLIIYPKVAGGGTSCTATHILISSSLHTIGTTLVPACKGYLHIFHLIFKPQRELETFT